MMRYAPLALVLLTIPALGAEEAASDGDNTKIWVGIATTAAIALVTWLASLFRKKVNSDSEKAEIDKEKSLWEQRNHLIDTRLTPFLISTAEHWLITNIAPILQDATDGDGFSWSDHWTRLRNYVKGRALKKFAKENVDLIERFGEEELDDLLDRVLLKLIGKLPESVQAFLPQEIVDKLTDFATKFATEKGKELVSG